MGGIAGLTAASCSVRACPFDEDGSVERYSGSPMTFAVLGTLILAFGWYGFNVGTAASVFVVDDGALALGAFATVGRVAMTTTVAMASAQSVPHWLRG